MKSKMNQRQKEQALIFEILVDVGLGSNLALIATIGTSVPTNQTTRIPMKKLEPSAGSMNHVIFGSPFCASARTGQMTNSVTTARKY